MSLYPCRVCQENKPRDSRHFYRAPENADGLRTACIPCTKEAARVRYAQDPESVLSVKRERRRERATHFATSPQWNAA